MLAVAQPREVTTGSMTGVGRSEDDSSFSESAQKLMRDARRDGTRKAYSTSWQKWAGWCGERNVDPFHATVGFVVNFLSELYEAGLEYSTLNGFRSAISASHVGFQGVKAGQHPQVCEILKGAFNNRPPQPRYTDTWDVGKVLTLFRQWPEDSGLQLKELSLKVTMLMALTGAVRQSELQLLQVNHMLDKGDTIQFLIGGLTKTRKVGQGPVSLEFATFPQDTKLDVVRCIRAYVARVARLRGNHNQLLVSYVKPHKPIVACSVARWLQLTMELAGVDVSKYKAHSTRGAATSKAKKVGLSSHEIMQRANWTRESTFKRFYCRDIPELEFQEAVLQ
jgi:hypothetical protein